MLHAIVWSSRSRMPDQHTAIRLYDQWMALCLRELSGWLRLPSVGAYSQHR